MTLNLDRKLNKSLIIFDWDGTLMDSIGLIVESIKKSGEFFGYNVTDEKARSIIGLSLERGIEIIFSEADEQQKADLCKLYVEYYANKSENSSLFDGVEKMITTLYQQGKLLAVATGKKRKGLERVYSSSGIQEYFVTSRCADESGSKPDPTMLKEILLETNTAIDQAIFIGDSIHDIQMANQIGMSSIAVNYGCEIPEILAKQNPTYQVNTIEELSALLLS